MRFFNTSGPVVPADHYCIPPLTRVDLDDVLQLVRNKRYFVLHAPRQTGKTSILLALRDLLNGGEVGEYRCVYFNAEVGQAAREDTTRAMQAMFRELASWARFTLQDSLIGEIWPGFLDEFGPDGALSEVLNHWAEADRKPLVLLIDEIDSLVGDTLISVLRQLRAGYVQRPERFPQSVVLCGVRDVRDYRMRSGPDNSVIAGGSAFNIKARSMRLGDLSREEVLALLAQHTEETGQGFTPEARETVWRQTQGQPWLVNALADATCFSHPAGRDRQRTIAVGDIEAAQEQLIASRETHLDQLADKLQEDRVRRVVEPLLSGGDERGFTARDIEYARDLGLVAQDAPLRIANPIYAEVIPRELTWAAQEGLVEDTAWYVDADEGSTLSSWWPPSRRSSGSIRSTGWSDSTTGRRGRSFSCRRSCNASSLAVAASSASTASGAAAPTSSSSGRGAIGPAGSSSSARCSTRAWSAPSRKGFDRPRGTWTAARRRPAIW